MDTLAQWMKDGWNFQPYSIPEGQVHTPLRYVTRDIKWRFVPNNTQGIPWEEVTRYYAETSTP